MRPYLITCTTGLLVASFFTQACNTSRTKRENYDMGEKIPAGVLNYTVIECKWRSQLGTSPTERLPERNFLLVRIQVTNSGASDQTVPALTLESPTGDTYTESTDGRSVDGWFGLVRRISPAMSDEGWLLFDVPTNSYRLRIPAPDSEGGERIYAVKLPLSLE